MKIEAEKALRMNALSSLSQIRLSQSHLNKMVSKMTANNYPQPIALQFQGQPDLPLSATGPVKPPNTMRQMMSKAVMGLALMLGISAGGAQLWPSKPAAEQNQPQVVVTQEAPPVAVAPAPSEPVPPHLLPIDPNYPPYPHYVGMRGRGIFRQGGCIYNYDPLHYRGDFNNWHDFGMAPFQYP
jgi:hypothetical protein